MNNNNERLQKAIANAGICSRRKAEILITSGRVSVNDEIVTTLGFKVTSSDIVKVDGQVITPVPTSIYLALYKPPNCVTTVSDPKNRPTVMRYVSAIKTRLYPVGRLDFDTSGLLLMTNDGQFANAIIHPRYKITKIYEVLAKGKIAPPALQQLQHGIKLDSNFTTAPAAVKVINIDNANNTTLLHLTIHEGHNQQVKRMISAIGSKVITLKRLQIATITLQGLKVGQYRYLTPKEVTYLIKLSANS